MAWGRNRPQVREGEGGALVADKGETEECTGECTRTTLPHSYWLGKLEGLIYMSFCNKRAQRGVLKVSVCLGTGRHATQGHEV